MLSSLHHTASPLKTNIWNKVYSTFWQLMAREARYLCKETTAYVRLTFVHEYSQTCLPLSHSHHGWWFSHWVMSDSWEPMDCSPRGSSGHGIFQARILEWIAIFFSNICVSEAENFSHAHSPAPPRKHLWLHLSIKIFQSVQASHRDAHTGRGNRGQITWCFWFHLLLFLATNTNLLSYIALRIKCKGVGT